MVTRNAARRSASARLGFMGLLGSLRLSRLPRWQVLGLGTKLLIIVTALTFVALLGSSFLLLSLQQEQVIANAEESITRWHAPIRATLEHAMVTHDNAMSVQIVTMLAHELNADSIRVLDNRGVVQISSGTGDLGIRLDSNAHECTLCHKSSGAIPSEHTAILQSSPDPVLVSVSSIPNGRQCYACHDSAQKSLGIIVIEQPLTELDNQLNASLARVSLGALASFVLMIGLLVPVLRRSIARPVQELSHAVAAIRSDDLESPLHVTSGDELGRLATAFEDMRLRLKASHDVMEHRNQELSVLYEVALITGQLLDLREILRRTLDLVIDKIGLQAGIIYLWDNEQGRYENFVCRGFSDEQLATIDRQRRAPNGDLTKDVAESGRVFFVADMTGIPHFSRVWGEGNRSYINVPLKSKGRSTGTMELVSRVGRPMTEQEQKVIEAVGHEIGIAIDNAALLAETRRSEHEALTLYQLGTEISSSLELGQVLQAVATGARQVLNADAGMVGLVDEAGEAIVPRAVSADSGLDLDRFCWPLESPELASTLGQGQPLRLEAWPADLAAWDGQAQFETMTAVPLWRGGALHGMVAVLFRRRRTPDESEVPLLQRLSQQVVIAIENARLYRQVRYLATLEERDRLAREIHDNVAQALGYLNLKASITDDLLVRGELPQARGSLGEMKQIIQGAYTDTREAIFNLRTTASPDPGVLAHLREYLAEYRAHYALETYLAVEDERLAVFPPETAIQVVRIIQEALANVRKHSGASRAWIGIESDGGLVRLTIQDNGRGFDLGTPGRDASGHFGLQIMRERAESVGGTLEIRSRAGDGTTVILRIPRGDA